MRVKILEKNDCYAAGEYIIPRGVMVHSTGANNPRLSRYVGPNVYNNDWNRPDVGACVHAFIGLENDGTVNTVQTLPWNMRGWHAGASANNTHISFEICEDGLKNREYFEQVYAEAVNLTAYLCKKFRLDPMADGVVICHSEGYRRGIASNHADVMHWFPIHGKTMDDFRRDVENAMKGDETVMYNSVAECPEYAQDVVRRLIDAGCISGTGTGRKDADGRPADLELTNEMIRLMVIFDRAGALNI